MASDSDVDRLATAAKERLAQRFEAAQVAAARAQRLRGMGIDALIQHGKVCDALVAGISYEGLARLGEAVALKKGTDRAAAETVARAHALKHEAKGLWQRAYYQQQAMDALMTHPQALNQGWTPQAIETLGRDIHQQVGGCFTDRVRAEETEKLVDAAAERPHTR